MNFRIFFLSIFFSSYAVFGQSLNQIVFDESAQQEILYGYGTIDFFHEDSFNTWFTPTFNEYTPEKTVVDNLKSLVDGIAIRIVLGTWCSDSRREVPRFIKILNEIDFPVERLEIIGVNRQKVAPEVGIMEGYVDYVPTFIIFQNDVEIGRIIELPNKTLEEDLLEILTNKVLQ
jgi:thiol-disulfide isomerase/thioredoxin